MTIIEHIGAYADELTALRRDLHAHPELGFEEVRTSAIVADLLERFGYTVHRGVGGTGVVGILRGRTDNGRRIGLRADMDALPIEEDTDLPYRSTKPGVMHACGHDGHTTMLLGAARYLGETRAFDGTAVLIFQPAEEGLGGSRAMLKDGLFERECAPRPCSETRRRILRCMSSSCPHAATRQTSDQRCNRARRHTGDTSDNPRFCRKVVPS